VPRSQRPNKNVFVSDELTDCSLVQLTGVAPLRQPVSAGCTRWPCGRRL